MISPASRPPPPLSSSFVQPSLLLPCFTQFLTLEVSLFLCMCVCVLALLCSLLSLIENRTKTGLSDPNNAALAPSMLAMLCFTLKPWTRPLEPSRTTPGPDIHTATYSHVHTLCGLILRATGPNLRLLLQTVS